MPFLRSPNLDSASFGAAIFSSKIVLLSILLNLLTRPTDLLINFRKNAADMQNTRADEHAFGKRHELCFVGLGTKSRNFRFDLQR